MCVCVYRKKNELLEKVGKLIQGCSPTPGLLPHPRAAFSVATK